MRGAVLMEELGRQGVWRDYLAENGFSVLGVKGFKLCALRFPVSRELEVLLPEMTVPMRLVDMLGVDDLGFVHVVCRVELERRGYF
jgi:hypothetical protein